MRRSNLLVLMALLAAMLIALSGPNGAMAASTSTFKGKPSVYYRNSGPYFVVNLTCSNGQLSGNWTYDIRTNSFSGTLGTPTDFATCALVQGNAAGSWSSSISPVPLYYLGSKTGTLTLVLSNIAASKTYVSDTSRTGPPPCPHLATQQTPYPACIQMTTSPFTSPMPSGVLPFDSRASQPANCATCGLPYGTLNLTLP